jgi:hypothetical protein
VLIPLSLEKAVRAKLTKIFTKKRAVKNNDG